MLSPTIRKLPIKTIRRRWHDFYFLGEGTAVDHQKSYYNAYFASCLGVPKFNDVSKYKIGLREDEIKQIEQEIDQLIS